MKAGFALFLNNSTSSLRSVSNVTARGMSVLSYGRASYGVCKSSFLDLLKNLLSWMRFFVFLWIVYSTFVVIEHKFCPSISNVQVEIIRFLPQQLLFRV